MDKFIFEAEKVKVSSGLFKDFVVCTAYLMSDGVNRNNSEFTLESLEKSLPSFENKPVLANIWFQNKGGNKKAYIGSHDWKVERDEDGEEYISYRGGETPVGVITDKSQLSIQKYRGRNFVVAKLFLWKQYNPELIKILARDKKKKVSVEVIFKDWEDYVDDNGQTIRRVKDFDFLGVTILGHQKKVFGDPEPIEEGIAGSHLTLDENQLEEYAVSFAKALETNIEDNREEYDAFIKANEEKLIYSDAEKKSIILEELYSQFNADIVLTYLFEKSLNSTSVEGGFCSAGKRYSFVADFNLDDSCNISVKELSEKEAEQMSKVEFQYLKQKRTNNNLVINEVNLVDDIKSYDIGQLIYNIFTYRNFADIVNLSFGNIENGWENDPYNKLSFPFAFINQNSIAFSVNRMKELEVGRLEELYKSVEEDTCFQKVRDIVKSIIEEKYEIGETSSVEKEEEAVKTAEEVDTSAENEIEGAKEAQKDENCDGLKTEENACGPEAESKGEGNKGEELDTEDCGGKPEENCGDAQSNCDGGEITANAEEEPKDGDDSDKEKDGEEVDEDAKKYEELTEKYNVAVSQITGYTEQISALTKELEEAHSTIAELKMSAFMKEVEEELSKSELDKEFKENIRTMAKEQKFANITDVQKEIAFTEKQTKTNSYTFVSNIVNTQKGQPKDVFEKLQTKNKW